jgi:predicted DCC family thiol-disulfide oxidoreductase YuxK
LNRAAPGRIPLKVSSLAELGGQLLVLFDGHCGLCNGAVRWLLRRDRRDRLHFVASEPAIVAELVSRHEIDEADLNSGFATISTTILVVREFGDPAERVLKRSDAVLALFGELQQPWPAVAAALRWIPRPVRDLAYRLVAHWRYRIWGRLTECPVPTAKERERFL